jgi:hypothetical protein
MPIVRPVRRSFLSAFLACLAVLASAAGTVASARVQYGTVGTQQVMTAPCSHCDDCEKVPCQFKGDCLQVNANAAPLLSAVAVEMTRLVDGIGYGSPGDTRLSGRSPPPDPFPPRL